MLQQIMHLTQLQPLSLQIHIKEVTILLKMVIKLNLAEKALLFEGVLSEAKQ